MGCCCVKNLLMQTYGSVMMLLHTVWACVICRFVAELASPLPSAQANDDARRRDDRDVGRTDQLHASSSGQLPLTAFQLSPSASPNFARHAPCRPPA